MKKILILILLITTGKANPQSFKEFFANNSLNGNLNSQFYKAHRYIRGYYDLEVYLENQGLTDLEGLDSIMIDNISLNEFDIIKFNLQNNKLASLSNIFSKIPNHKSINLQNNQLSYLPESFANSQKLTYLNLSNNNFKFLPNSITRIISLKHLNLNHNYLTSLPPNFTDLTNLRTLNLKNNLLTFLPNTICNLSKLYTLNLKNNPLIHIPQNFINKEGYLFSGYSNYSLQDTPIGAFLNSIKGKYRLQQVLTSRFYQSYILDNKVRAGSYNPIITLKLSKPLTPIKEQFNKQRTKKRKIEETESVEYQLPQEIIRNIYTYLD